MKTSIILSTIALLLGFSSCSRCVKCTKGADERSFCESNFSSETAFDAEVTTFEAQGYTCTSGN